MRNPTSRFYASYDEMFARRLNNGWKRVPKNLAAFSKPFNGWTYEKYSALFETKKGVELLTDTFELFVKDFTGYPFDEHLTLQVPPISYSNGFTIPFDFIINTKDMNHMFDIIAERVNAPKPEVIRGRSYPRRFNTSRLSKETMLKICHLSLIDYCCLNYELPPECVSDWIPEGKRPSCEWVSIDNEKYIKEVLL